MEWKDVLKGRLANLIAARNVFACLLHDMNVAVPGSGWKIGVDFNGTHDFKF